MAETAPTHRRPGDAEQSPARAIWWLLLLRGLLAVVFGLVAVIAPLETMAALLVLFGVFSIVDGLVAILAGLITRGTAWGWVVFTGLLGVGIGLIALRHPATTLLAMILVIAVWALVTGLFGVFGAFEARREGDRSWGWTLLSGLLSVVLGLLFVANPIAGAGTVILVTGVYAVVFGVLWIGAAFAVRSAVRS